MMGEIPVGFMRTGVAKWEKIKKNGDGGRKWRKI